MPEEQPLQALAPLELVLEAEVVLLIVEFGQVEQLGRGLHHGERGRLGVVDEDGDATVGIETEEPFFLLLVGHDVDQGRGPFGTIDIGQFLEEDLDLLTIGRALRDEMKTLRILDLSGSFVDVQRMRRHCSGDGMPTGSRRIGSR